MANRALLKRPYDELTGGHPSKAGPLWVAASVIERPAGSVIRLGALFVTAPSETDALEAAEAILEANFPESQGYLRTFDVVPVKRAVLEHGLNWFKRGAASDG